MSRFFWKEWRERRVWLLLWAAAIIILGALRLGQLSTGFHDDYSSWVSLLYLLALLTGLSGYGSELTGERAAFLDSRARCWKRLLLAKVLVGLVVAVGAPLIAALVMRLLAPAPYAPFMTPWHLLQGAALLAFYLGAFYLLGLACSIVLPGLGGGIVTLLAVYAATQLILYYQHTLPQRATPALMYLCPVITSLLTLVILARFGVTLPPMQRLRRFGVLLGGVATACLVAELLPPIQRWEDQLLARMPYDWVQVNPAGSLACIRHIGWSKGNMHDAGMYLWPLSAQQVPPIPLRKLGGCTWLSNECMLTSNADSDNFVLLWLEHGQVRSHEFGEVQYSNLKQCFLSPDGRQVLLDCTTDVKLFNMTTGRVQEIFDGRISQFKWTAAEIVCWWQSATVIGYIDPVSLKRVMVTVEEATPAAHTSRSEAVPAPGAAGGAVEHHWAAGEFAGGHQ